nr:conserved hypothetical protein, DUF586 family [uncultured archaeon]
MEEKALNLDYYAPIFSIKIGGKPQPELKNAVISLDVDENIEKASMFTMNINEGLDIKTQKFAWLENPLLNPGKEVEIYFGYAGKKSKSLFKGTIKALSPSFPSTGIPTLTVEGYDPSHTMQKKMTKINDINVKYSDIAKELAAKYHLNTDGIEDSKKKYSKVGRKKGEKDYNFLRRLANKLGFEFFVQGGTLYFRAPKDAKDDKKIVKTFRYRKNLISFSPRLSMATLVREVAVSGWNKKTKKPIKESLMLKDIGTGPDISSLEKLIKASEGSEPLIIEHKAFSSVDEAKNTAEVELKKAINNFIQGNLECIGDVDLRAGNNIKIEGLGDMFSGYYYITSAKHTFNDNGYRTTLGIRRIVFESEGGLSKSSVDLPLNLLNQEDDALTGQFYGVFIGVVTNNKDKGGMGRVKVKFPWRGDSDESYWARIATLMAGGDRGTFFLPEVDDEVLVAFDHGDINHPYVIGALWNGVDTPPETNADGKNNIRKIKSRSGHEIIFDDNDEQKKEKIEIRTKAGHAIVLDDSAGKEKIEIKDKTGNNTITIDSVQNSINIESAMQLKIKANVVEIEGTTSLTLKSNAALTIQGLPVKIN